MSRARQVAGLGCGRDDPPPVRKLVKFRRRAGFYQIYVDDEDEDVLDVFESAAEVPAGRSAVFGWLVLVRVKKVDVLWKRGKIMSGQLCNLRAEPRAEGGSDNAHYP